MPLTHDMDPDFSHHVWIKLRGDSLMSSDHQDQMEELGGWMGDMGITGEDVRSSYFRAPGEGIYPMGRATHMVLGFKDHAKATLVKLTWG